MKRIVILCDGTWNQTDSATPTNVVRLAKVLEPIDSTGIMQIPIYVPGVGTGEGVTKVSRILDKILGGVFGWGLLNNIVEAYRHLVFLYEPGDEIYIFGFSRGAYTARSLTGFIRSSGIVDREQLHLIPDAIARYQNKSDDTTHPSSDQSHQFRAKISPRVATSEKEADWRVTQGLEKPPVLTVNYLGVWDSVGALGVPRHLSLVSWISRGRYEFHDASLSSMVGAARHAVALDETRRSFAPTQWDNLDQLNRVSKQSQPTYLEQFFLGDHGSVGGGGDLTHLSSIGLLWILEGAQSAGLEFDQTKLQSIEGEQDLTGILRNTTQAPTGLANWLMRVRPLDRTGPSSPDQLHETAFKRWQMEAKDGGEFQPYRPGSLKNIEVQLAALQQQQVYGDSAQV